MGWDVVDSGFKVVLSAQVPQVVEEHVGADVDAFLAEHGLAAAGHPPLDGPHRRPPRALGLPGRARPPPEAALARSWRSLQEVGNLSSASVLFVLGDLLEAGEARPGDLGLLAAMGPGFSSELVLLAW